MNRNSLMTLSIWIILLLLSACSRESTKVEPLVIKSDVERKDVKTEVDVLQDIKQRIKNVYFPTEVGELEELYIRYEVENDDISLFYNYNAREEAEEDYSNIPARFRLFMNEEFVSKIEEKRIVDEEEGNYLVHNSMEGYYDSNGTELDYDGKDHEYDDEFVYKFDRINNEQFFHSLYESGMQSVQNMDDIEGYALFGNLLQLNMNKISFLDVANTNFDITGVYMKLINKGDPLYIYSTSMEIYYKYKGYRITFTVYEPELNNSPVHFSEDGYDYGLVIYHEDEDVEIEDEEYKEVFDEVRGLMTRKVTDD